MPKIRDPALNQHHAGQAHWGELDLELFPTPTGSNVVGVIPYFDGVQWQWVRLTAGGSLDLTYNSVEKTLEITSADVRVYGSFGADATTLRTTATTFLANAELVV